MSERNKFLSNYLSEMSDIICASMSVSRTVSQFVAKSLLDRTVLVGGSLVRIIDSRRLGKHLMGMHYDTMRLGIVDEMVKRSDDLRLVDLNAARHVRVVALQRCHEADDGKVASGPLIAEIAMVMTAEGFSPQTVSVAVSKLTESQPAMYTTDYLLPAKFVSPLGHSSNLTTET